MIFLFFNFTSHVRISEKSVKKIRKRPPLIIIVPHNKLQIFKDMNNGTFFITAFKS